jgi:hypothetical protein
MRLRPHRRNLVVWNQSASLTGRHEIPFFTRLGHARPFLRSIRVGALLPAVGLMLVERALQTRWPPVLAGAVLTVIGVILRGGPGGAVLLPGLVFLAYGPFIPVSPDLGRKQRRELKRELAAYSTAAQRRDLEATLDRYPDRTTGELREILHDLATATYVSRLAGDRRRPR